MENFKMFSWGNQTHGRPSFLLFVFETLLTDNKLQFPLKARIKKTQNNIMLLPYDETVVFDVFVTCGYRGSSDINIITKYNIAIPYYKYRSQLGNLGISQGYLIETNITDLPLIIEYKKTGKTYGEPKFGIILFDINNITPYPGVTYEEYKQILNTTIQ